jgi:hypothetical protein
MGNESKREIVEPESPICRRAFLGLAPKIAGAGLLAGLLGGFGMGCAGEVGVQVRYRPPYSDYANYSNYANYSDYQNYSNYSDYQNYYNYYR